MKKIFVTAAALSFLASASFANTDYPLSVTANGKNYLCKDEIVKLADGRDGRMCILNDDDGGMLFKTSGLSGTAAVGLGLLGLIVVGASLGDSDSTNGTN